MEHWNDRPRAFLEKFHQLKGSVGRVHKARNPCEQGSLLSVAGQAADSEPTEDRHPGNIERGVSALPLVRIQNTIRKDGFGGPLLRPTKGQLPPPGQKNRMLLLALDRNMTFQAVTNITYYINSFKR